MDDHEHVLRPGDTLCDKSYVTQRFVGRGKYAQVYAAEDARMRDTDGGDARVAIKILHPEYARNTEARQRLKREGDLQKYEALGRHRNIVTVLADGVHSYRDPDTKQPVHLPFLVMEYVTHKTLCDYLQEHPSGVPIDATLIEITQQLGNALAWIHTHSQQVVHRDLADHNILLRCKRDARGNLQFQPGEGFVQITDFGLAFAHPATTITQDRTNHIAANLNYASPEILHGAIPTAQDDLYSFGVLMYRLLTGQYPFLCKPDDLQDLVDAVSYRPVMFPDPDAIPDPVQDCLIKAMAKKRKDRYASAREMTEALITALEQWQKTLPALVHKAKAARPTAVSPRPSQKPETQSPSAGTASSASPPVSKPKKPPRKILGCWVWVLRITFLMTGMLLCLIVSWVGGWIRGTPLATPTSQLPLNTPEVIHGTPVPPVDPIPTLVVTTPPSSHAPGWETVTDLAFAYISYHEGVSNITGSPRETTLPHRALFSEEGQIEHLTWSPDGDLLAYTSDADGEPAVYVADGLSTRRLSPPGVTQRWPAWRPDSQALVVSTETTHYTHLTLIDMLSGQPTPLTGAYFNAWAPAWSQTDDYLAFVADIGEGQDVYVLALNDLDRAPVNISRTGDVLIDTPAWAPDGKWIVFATANGLRWVGIENLAPGTPHTFTHHGQDRAPCFIGAREILFQRTSGAGTVSIYQGQLGNEIQQRVVAQAAWPACRP